MFSRWLAIGLTGLFPACEFEDKSPLYEVHAEGAVIQVREDCDCVRIENRERSLLFYDLTPADTSPDLELVMSGDTVKNRNYIGGNSGKAIYHGRFERIRKEEGFIDIHLWRLHTDSGMKRFGEAQRFRIETYP